MQLVAMGTDEREAAVDLAFAIRDERRSHRVDDDIDGVDRDRFGRPFRFVARGDGPRPRPAARNSSRVREGDVRSAGIGHAPTPGPTARVARRTRRGCCGRRDHGCRRGAARCGARSTRSKSPRARRSAARGTTEQIVEEVTPLRRPTLDNSRSSGENTLTRSRPRDPACDSSRFRLSSTRFGPTARIATSRQLTPFARSATSARRIASSPPCVRARGREPHETIARRPAHPIASSTLVFPTTVGPEQHGEPRRKLDVRCSAKHRKFVSHNCVRAGASPVRGRRGHVGYEVRTGIRRYMKSSPSAAQRGRLNGSIVSSATSAPSIASMPSRRNCGLNATVSSVPSNSPPSTSSSHYRRLGPTSTSRGRPDSWQPYRPCRGSGPRSAHGRARPGGHAHGSRFGYPLGMSCS